MDYKLKHHFKKEEGFALLITLIVVSTVLSVGVAMLELSIKQVRLSTNTKDSEIAFHAANAGVECAQYIRRINAPSAGDPFPSPDMEKGEVITPSCFGSATISNELVNITPTDVNGDGEAYLYNYSFTWGVTNNHCTKITTLIASSTQGLSGMLVNNIPVLIEGYPSVGTTPGQMFCEAGARCTVISVRGYNKACSNINTYGVVEREVLLEY